LGALPFAALALLYLIYVAITLPVSAAVAAAGYAVGMPVAYLAGLGQVLVTRPPSLGSPPRRPRRPEGADPALLQYFYGPAIADADQAVRAAYGSCRKFWEFGAAAIQSSFEMDGSPMLTAPLGAGGAIGMAVGTAAGAVLTAGCALVHLLVVGASAVSVRATGAVLRAADSTLLRIKNIRMVCPDCYRRVFYPGYECPSPDCANRHRDVRPGRFGIFRRRCRCGTPMNTLLLLGSARMSAFCPHEDCGGSLAYRPGEAPEIVLPFFGATGAGKTRLMFSMVTQLQLWTEAGRLRAEFGDSVTSTELEGAGDVLRSGRATTITSVQDPRANVIRLVSRNSTRILHLFDAAGELFYQSDRTQSLRYLSQARTFILVIDPLSVAAFWQRLPAEKQAELAPLRSTAPSPDLAYQQTYQQIEAMGVRLRAARLAVVFSRADLTGVPAGDVAAWASGELGLGNMVRSVRQNFRETCFINTAAVMAKDGTMHESVAALLRWMLARDRVKLPKGT
jgi:Double-GTPase 2